MWRSLEAEGGELFLALRELHESAPDSTHAWFPRSLRALEANPDPIPIF